MIISMLRLRINLPDIQAMVYVETSWNLLNYIQERGRTERDNRVSNTVVLQSQAVVYDVKDQNILLQQYLTVIDCCRIVLNVYLDSNLSPDSYTNTMTVCNLYAAYRTDFSFSFAVIIRFVFSSPESVRIESKLGRIQQH